MHYPSPIYLLQSTSWRKQLSLQRHAVNVGTECSIYSQVLGLAVKGRQILYFIVGIHKLEVEVLEEQRDGDGSLLQCKLVPYAITDVSFWGRLVLE